MVEFLVEFLVVSLKLSPHCVAALDLPRMTLIPAAALLW